MNHRWPHTPIPPGATFIEEHCTRCGAVSLRRATTRTYPNGRKHCMDRNMKWHELAHLAAKINQLVEFRAVERMG